MKKSLHQVLYIAVSLAVLALVSACASEPVEPTPDPRFAYIDGIRNKLKAREERSNESYIAKIKQDLAERDADSGRAPAQESYIQKLREQDPTLSPQTPPTSGYSDKEYIQKLREKIDEKDAEKREKSDRPASAIQAVREGRSKLKLERPGEIHHAAGLRASVNSTRNYSANDEYRGNSFTDIYSNNPIDFGFFYEYQPFHSEWFGNIGLMAQGGVFYNSGYGRFKVPLANFPITSRTKFSFMEVPVALALSYRFNLLRILRPFAAIGPMISMYSETRDDGKANNSGYSTGLFMTGGVMLLLDWISRDVAFDIYDSWGIKHSYLTAEYISRSTPSSAVDFKYTGIQVGITFEY